MEDRRSKDRGLLPSVWLPCPCSGPLVPAKEVYEECRVGGDAQASTARGHTTALDLDVLLSHACNRVCKLWSGLREKPIDDVGEAL